jgi:hypothetical protein
MVLARAGFAGDSRTLDCRGSASPGLNHGLQEMLQLFSLRQFTGRADRATATLLPQG